MQVFTSLKQATIDEFAVWRPCKYLTSEFKLYKLDHFRLNHSHHVGHDAVIVGNCKRRRQRSPRSSKMTFGMAWLLAKSKPAGKRESGYDVVSVSVNRIRR